MRRLKKLFVAALAMTPALSFGQPDTTRITLSEALQMGLERNYDIRIIRNSEAITDNNATRDNAGYYPTVDASGGYNGTLNNSRQFYESGGSNHDKNIYNQSLSAGLNMNWTAFNGFSARTTYEKLLHYKTIGALNTQLIIERFIANFTAEYYGYIRQYRRLQNLHYAVKLSQERVRIVEARYTVGNESLLSVQQAKVDLNADRSNLIKQYEVMHTLRTTLNESLAMDDIERDFPIADTVITFDDTLDREAIWKCALENNIILKISKEDRQISLLDLQQVRNERLPYLRLNAGYGYTGNWYGSGSYTRQNDIGLNYGLTVGVNIFDGLNRRRRETNARIDANTRELEWEQCEQSLRVDLSQAWMAYRNNMELTALERDNLETARDNYTIAMERYKLGELAGIELREAQNSLLEAEERLLEALYNTKLCEISLNNIGGLIYKYL